MTDPVPGAWRRLSLISRDGTLTGLKEENLIARLDEFGIPRHQFGVARLLYSWKRARVPPDVALALWLLRQQQQSDGCIYRSADAPVEEAGPAIRYVQLAVAAGETMQTDPALEAAARWLVDRQLPDGSIPAIVDSGCGEAGSTARALRVLGQLDEPWLVEPLERMRMYLERTAVAQPVGVAWSYSTEERTAVTGATSLAVLALIEDGCRGPAVIEGLRFLLAVQSRGGGWPEVPGFPPTIHNTFNVVRALHAGQAADLLNDDPSPSLKAACQWFLPAVRRAPRSTLDQAYALRLAAELNLLGIKRIERLALRLTKRHRQALSITADLYAETEIAAVALLECSQRVDASAVPEQSSSWRWRWVLPALPPPFLCRHRYFYEALYSAIKARWWIRTVDALADASVVEGTAGLLLGTIAALGIVDDRLTAAFTVVQADARSVLAAATVGLLLLLWFGVKLTARRAVAGAVWVSVGALLLTLAITWILPSPAPTPTALLPVIGLRWLIIDAVAFTADRSGLLERLIPR
jgi:hypothetical protein